MSNRNFDPGLTRRQVEDHIMHRYEAVNFQQKAHAWLEDQAFWDYVFAWYDLAKYYEDHPQDTTIGAHMLDLYAHCVQLFRQAAADTTIKERRRDKAADALYQVSYALNQMSVAIHRNAQQG